jgi:hypothetical protein
MFLNLLVPVLRKSIARAERKKLEAEKRKIPHSML